MSRARSAGAAPAVLAAAAAAAAVVLGAATPPRLEAAGGITPGVAAGGVPLSADVQTVMRLLGRPSDELRDPTNRSIYIQRWEPLCLGARYTPQGELLALDVWADLGDVCQHAEAYGVAGEGGAEITFASGREDVKRAFGFRPERVLRARRFTIFVYDAEGVAFYIREDGERRGRVDAITVFPKEGSENVWAPSAWGGR
jgi:hypothetical protein